jgi:sulfoxide reductase heme-binding subunit YedZ
VVHYSMQSKLEQWEPTIMAGLLAWLLLYRLLHRFLAVRQRLALPWVAGLSIAAGILTALGEALYFWIAYSAPPGRVLPANWSLDLGVRPAVVVLGLGLAVTLAGAVRLWGPSLIKLRIKLRPRAA